MMSKKINIAITDDHPMVITGIVELLQNEDQFDVIAKYENAKETLDNFLKDNIDILLLDINLPDISGVDLSSQLLKIKPDLKIIALSSFSQTAFIKQLMKNGAKGYLPKTIGKEELIKALDDVANGEIHLHPKMKEILLQDAIGNPVNRSFIPNLTRREKEILKLIIDEYTSAEISKELNISIKTVESHRAHLFQKLNVKNIAGLVRVTLERGLLED